MMFHLLLTTLVIMNCHLTKLSKSVTGAGQTIPFLFSMVDIFDGGLHEGSLLDDTCIHSVAHLDISLLDIFFLLTFTTTMFSCIWRLP